MLRAIGVGIEHAAVSVPEASQQIGLRMAYMLGPLFLTLDAVIVARQAYGRDAGITALAVVVFAFTMQPPCPPLATGGRDERPRKGAVGITAFYVFGLIVLAVIFGISTHMNHEFLPQNEFKLDTGSASGLHYQQAVCT